MITVLAAPLLLLAFAVGPGLFSRLIGAKFAAALLFSTGVVVVPVLVGVTWRAVLVAGCDAAILLAGASLTRASGFSHDVYTVWLRRVAAAFSGGLLICFAALALIMAYLTGVAANALPFDFGMLASGIALATLLSRSQEQSFTRNEGSSFAPVSP